jgi:NAD(P)-dependent dehydrogenase (short-subunit alcohol dehydrogenase family)
MSRIFITGSTDGLGLLAARRLLDEGHDVVLHARTPQRAADLRARVPQSSDVVVGDLSTFAAITDVAAQVNDLGRFDAVIHNAGIAYNDPGRTETEDGITTMFAVNVAAPYLLTALVTRPERLVYLSSGMHRGADASLDDPQWTSRRWSATRAYSDSKAHLTSLALAVARLWPDVLVNAVDPGWVPTKMGGPGASDDLDLGSLTQAWLAVSDDPAATVTGGYFHHQQLQQPDSATTGTQTQDALLAYCRGLTGVELPSAP